MSDPFLALLSPPTDDPEYVWAQWAGTGFLMENAHDFEVMARDESLEDEVRVRAALNARAIRGDWLAQCEADARPTDLPLLVFRRNRSQAYACLPLDELLVLLKLREETL